MPPVGSFPESRPRNISRGASDLGDQMESIRDGRVTGPNSRVTGPRWPCYSGNAKALMHTTCVQEKSNRATGPHIDTCVCHLAGTANPPRLADNGAVPETGVNP